MKSRPPNFETSSLNSALNNKKLQISFLIFASLLIFLGRQLDTGITIYDDVYYAQKAKEVLNSGSLWDITFAGTPAFDNPPLPFWFTWLCPLAYLGFPAIQQFFPQPYLVPESFS